MLTFGDLADVRVCLATVVVVELVVPELAAVLDTPGIVRLAGTPRPAGTQKQ